MKLFYYDSLLEKIKENVNLNEELYCVSNQININNSFLSIQDKQGSMLQGKKAKLTNRTFSITGTIEASKIEDVEKIRSDIFNKLYNRELALFINNEDVYFYKCILNGSLQVSYFQGYEISRTFTISFNLVSLDPLMYEKKENVITFTTNNEEKENVNFLEVFPILIIEAKKEVKILKEKNPFITFTLYKNNKKTIYEVQFEEEITLKEKEKIVIKKDSFTHLKITEENTEENGYKRKELKTNIKYVLNPIKFFNGEKCKITFRETAKAENFNVSFIARRYFL